jgi:hypothetical protein
VTVTVAIDVALDWLPCSAGKSVARKRIWIALATACPCPAPPLVVAPVGSVAPLGYRKTVTEVVYELRHQPPMVGPYEAQVYDL